MQINLFACPCADDRDMAGRYVHMFMGRSSDSGQQQVQAMGGCVRF